MRIPIFRMERMQSTYEQAVAHNLSESGVHPLRLEELLASSRSKVHLEKICLHYCPTNGSAQLRDRIARFYPGAARDNILVTNGGAEANYLTFWSLLESGDRVACQIPNYLQTWGLSRIYSRPPDRYRLIRRRDGKPYRWCLDIDSLRGAVSKKTRLILVTNPNNPTGAVLAESEMDAIVRAARKVGAWIVADEIYRGAELNGRTTPTFWGRYSRVIVTSGLSKAFGLPGLRIGWVVAPPRIVERLWSHKDYTTIAPGLLSDRLAQIAMQPAQRQAIFRRTRGLLLENLPILEEWIQSHGNLFTYTRPQAGAIAFLKYRPSIRSDVLVDRLRREQSVLIVSGDQCGVPRHIRIGYGLPKGELRAGLQRMSRLLANL